jgi:hypothetical protein
MGMTPTDWTLEQAEKTQSSSGTLSQFGILIQEALFANDQEDQGQAWQSLFSFVSVKKAEEGEEWLGLEEFLARLEQWRIGKTLDEIILVFGADDTKLAEWFNSLMAPSSAPPDNGGGTSAETADFFTEPVATKSIVFDMNDLRVADHLIFDVHNHWPVCSGDDSPKSNDIGYKVFDLHEMSFVDSLVS